MPEAFVYIVPDEERVTPKARHLYWEFQDKNGFFKFVHIPPGKYVIVVNPDDSQNPDFPYRRTFYPGAHERSSAGVVNLREGEQLGGVDIRLAQGFAQRHLRVRVTWDDGRLIRNFVFVTARGTASPAAASDASQPDLKASLLELNVLPEEPYEVEAVLTCRYADKRGEGPGATLKSNRVYLTPGDGRTELVLTIPGTACPDISGKTLVTER